MLIVLRWLWAIDGEISSCVTLAGKRWRERRLFFQESWKKAPPIPPLKPWHELFILPIYQRQTMTWFFIDKSSTFTSLKASSDRASIACTRSYTDVDLLTLILVRSKHSAGFQPTPSPLTFSPIVVGAEPNQYWGKVLKNPKKFQLLLFLLWIPTDCRIAVDVRRPLTPLFLISSPLLELTHYAWVWSNNNCRLTLTFSDPPLVHSLLALQLEQTQHAMTWKWDSPSPSPWRPKFPHLQ